MDEIWKDVKFFEGFYQISNFGRVKSLAREKKIKSGKTKIMPEMIRKFFTDELGFNSIVLTKNENKKTYYVHRLVAEHFLTNENNYAFVIHIDGDRKNNKLENLKYVKNIFCK